MRRCTTDMGLWRAVRPFVTLAVVLGALALAFHPVVAFVAAVVAAACMHEQMATLQALLVHRTSPGAWLLLRETAKVVDEAGMADPPRVTLCGAGASPYYHAGDHVIAVPVELARLSPRMRRGVVLHETAHALQRDRLLKLFNRTAPVRFSITASLVVSVAGMMVLPEVRAAFWLLCTALFVGPTLVWNALANNDMLDEADDLEVEADLFAVKKANLTLPEYEQLHHEMYERVFGVSDPHERLREMRSDEHRKRHCAVRDALLSPA